MEEHLLEKFIKTLKYMNRTMKEDIANGNVWKYCNSSKKKERGFEEARQAGIFLINCVDGVQWAMQIAGLPSNTCAWYGSYDRIVWLNPKAEKRASKYFDIIRVGDKTVQQLYDANELYDGDILTYVNISHTNCYLGNGKSFDSGHAYASAQGEMAPMRKWIGKLAHKTQKVAYILRWKDRAHYNVVVEINEISKAFLDKKGYKYTESGGLYYIGDYEAKTHANKLAEKLKKKSLNAYVSEVQQ